MFQICGALSERGYDLIKIRDIAVEANKNMATLGVCLSACSLPGKLHFISFTHPKFIASVVYSDCTTLIMLGTSTYQTLVL